MPDIGGPSRRPALRRRQHTTLACLATMLAASPHARADDFQPLSSQPDSGVTVTYPTQTAGCPTRLLGGMDLTIINNIPLVTVTANDRPITLILDTGAQSTILTTQAAQRLGAQTPAIAFKRQLQGIGGTMAATEFELRSFAAGTTTFAWRRVLAAALPLPTLPDHPIDGLLGADALSDFDIDFDARNHRLSFYQPQTCPDPAPSWAATTMQAGLSPAGHLFFPVTLDGRPVTALIDTGAQHSAVSTTTAASLGLSVGTLAAGRLVIATGATGEHMPSNIHRFRSLVVAGVDMPDPVLTVTNLTLNDADLILGMDFVLARHVWLSYAARRVAVSGN